MPGKLRELFNTLRIISIFIKSVFISNCYYKISTQPRVNFFFAVAFFSWTSLRIFFATLKDNLKWFAFLRVLISLYDNIILV